MDIQLLRECVEKYQKLSKKDKKEFGKKESKLLDELEKSADEQRARAYFESKEGRELSEHEVITKTWKFLKDFLKQQL
ncbi:hypothetical protein [Helicobacter suis]|uniref:hypothetical protein n=1 Tax=Helicobacter suis TaxID=104628 RepID=UPI0013D02175|nr:hypothetical protein [Helicobacter suis]